MAAAHGARPGEEQVEAQEGEKANRQRPYLTKVNPKRVYTEARKMFSRRDETMRRPVKMKWDKFWGARWQWSAGGSIHSQYPEHLEGVPKQRELKNKFIALSIMPDLLF